jgi:hypothetical protein
MVFMPTATAYAVPEDTHLEVPSPAEIAALIAEIIVELPNIPEPETQLPIANVP